MTQHERAGFINFVSARSRLPANAADFPMRFKIKMASARENPDIQLPHAQTCFFQLVLPEYSSSEICKERILYAVMNPPNMDGDFVDRTGEGWNSVTP